MKKTLTVLIFKLIFIGLSPSYAVHSTNLSGKWKVLWSGGHVFSKDPNTFIQSDPLLDSVRYVSVDVPMDLNEAMHKRGMIGDINFGTNTFSANWIGEQYWKYYRFFNLPDDAQGKSIWLTFDQLDYHATILLNGGIIGTHKNAYTPCRIDITKYVKKTGNLLVVAIESGYYDAADREGSIYSNEMTSLVSKRNWLRKPQYQFGWDSSPKLVNVGITGEVKLEWNETARLDQLVVFSKLNEDLTSADVTIRPFIEGLTNDATVTLEATLLETGQKVVSERTFNRSISPVDLKMTVKNPELWWPNGYGKQNQYTVRMELKVNGKCIDSTDRRIGFREVEIDRSKHPVEGSYFTVKINHQKIFIKGGDWVPADLIFSSVTKERTNEALNLAVNANFNFLRIWGGGNYVGNDFLELCDQKGILVWHDFPFACIEYPADNLDFYNAVKEEVTQKVREYAYHPSMILWCGSNENELFTGGFVSYGKVAPDYILYHFLFPNVIKSENPQIFYWPSSPYSENNENPNSPITGDQHPWSVSLNFMGNDGPNFYGYRNHVDRFATEGGFLGASPLASLRQFLPKEEQYVRSISWDHHDNTFWKPENISYWLGKNYSDLTFEDYVFAGSTIQAEALKEYISNYHRRKFSSSAAIFWMYKDGWPASQSWSVVDYYNRKKLAYYTVTRAFKQITVVVAEEADKVNVYGINDHLTDWKGNLNYGIFKNAGGYVINETIPVTLPANTSVILASFDKDIYEKAGYTDHGAFAVLKDTNQIPVSQYTFLKEKFMNVKFSEPKIAISKKADYVILTSPVYVWAACTDVEGDADVSDNCFDLLPGIPYYVKTRPNEKLSIRKTGNELIRRINK
ncbi:MAG TPA: hypothetical protein VFP20_09080 [Bacteroidales bacterium]|nr:hypothetical protein [Bacteroidales bacterium]